MEYTLSHSKPGLSQEGLKLIACITMLLDHVGAFLIPDLFLMAANSGSPYAHAFLEAEELLRTVGRLAFPIYCFLLVEGVHHTRSPKRYGLRLAISMLLSELPFDLAVHGTFSWRNQSVMVTLLLGFLALQCMKRTGRIWLKLLLALPFAWLAEWMHTDYGGNGIWLMVLFDLTRACKHRGWLQFFGIWFLFSPFHGMMLNWIGGFSLTIQELAALAALPISCYNGVKKSQNKAVQWAFYLFYPVHLLILWAVCKLIAV